MTASSLPLTARSRPRPAWGRLAGAASGVVNAGLCYVTRALGMIPAPRLLPLVVAAAVQWALPRGAERAS